MAKDVRVTLKAAAQRRRKAVEAERAAGAELRDAVREARRAGVPIAEIARVAELSRQTVYNLLDTDH